MQSVATHSPAGPEEREGVPVFSVVLVFEDFDTGKRAKRAYDFLVANLTKEWRVTSQMWKFEMLSIPELREIAAKDAAMANLIIVSSRGDRELPAEVKDWIELWQGDKGEPVGLVALFDLPSNQAQHAQATQNYLERMAERGQMEFFTWPEIDFGQRRRQEWVIQDGHAGLTDEPFLPLSAMSAREVSFAHWGINE